jgi:hypothetical protein
MTEPELDAERAEAQALKRSNEVQTAALSRAIRQEYAPMWRRLTLLSVPDTLGREYTISLTPKGAHL